MKRVLGFDLGTTSIGWAYINEAENEAEESNIVKLGVRVNPLSTDEQQDFEKGKSITLNADRTQKRGARRNLQRYKQRRNNLIEICKKAGFVSNEAVLSEEGKKSTYQTLELRARAARSRIEKNEFVRVLLSINKKRGYKSSRKTKNEEEGQAIDGMSVALKLYEENLTPGQYCYQLLKGGKKTMPDFYRSDLKAELDTVWGFQKQFYQELLTEEFHKEIDGKNGKVTWAICAKNFNLIGVKRTGNSTEKKLENYKWRTQAIDEKLDLERLGVVFQEINNNLNSSSGYLGAISDRSKKLYFDKLTVGEYLYKQILENPHTRLKGQVFYRQDYLDEFEQIWETQASSYPEMTKELKEEIRDVIIFYQRRLKSQKGLISFCEFESKEVELEVDGRLRTKTIGARVCPKSSPLFQEFKIWQNLSNLEFQNKKSKEKIRFVDYELEEKKSLFEELNIKGTLKKNGVLKLFNLDQEEWDINYTELQGNRSNMVLYDAFEKILIHSGHKDLKKMQAYEAREAVHSVFETLGISTDILYFNAELDGGDFEKQKSFQLWHLLYSYEGDNSNTGNDALFSKLKEKFGIDEEYAKYLVNLDFQDDYGNLSSKAIRKIFPHIKENVFSKACVLAGYNHSHSLTKDENKERPLKGTLELLPKNSLRNPVVEKILNQLVNLMNTIIAEPTLGKPDEIRIELARDLKNSAKERADATKGINAAKTKHEEFRKILQTEFFIPNPTRNDIIRYKLYKELAFNGYHTLYSNTYIEPNELFSKKFDIEHIIPKARLFDDSFSNKTIEVRSVNLQKSDETAYDYVKNNFGENGLQKYVDLVEKFFKEGKDAFGNSISKAKYRKLLMKGTEIGEGFIERDLRESQYIAKKAKQMLLEVCETVVSSSGKITDRLREDWGLINTMKELNLPKYRRLGLTEIEERKNGQSVEVIKDWTKRNDHRHHAMDALTVAFTKHNHIQYLNNLNAKDDKHGKHKPNIYAIEQKETYKDENNRRLFKLPMPNFRTEAKKHLEGILVSHKAKNKVVTRNKNRTKGCVKTQISLTPRGQLHKETIYGLSKNYVTKEVKVGAAFDEDLIKKVAKPAYREALFKRLYENDNIPKKAFGGKNSPSKNPVITKNNQQVPEKVELVWLGDNYTIRKDITPENFKNKKLIDKVVDEGIKKILFKRLKDYNNNPQEAFSNLDKKPIWFNKEKGISIKRATISGVSNAEALHTKSNHLGETIYDKQGKEIPVDFVSTGNNHHVAIYKDGKGKLQEEVVSFYEAVARVNEGMPVIDKKHKRGWEFLFTMKQNEMFVFPSDDFDPEEIDLMNSRNYYLISPHLFRVQKIATKDYFFRHHLETTVETNSKLKGVKWKREGINGIASIIKVRVNHIGQIVQVGEY